MLQSWFNVFLKRRSVLRIIIVICCCTIFLLSSCCPRGQLEGLVRFLDAIVKNTVVVTTFNIHHDAGDWGSRRILVIRAIERERADVVGLQEAYTWQVREIIKEIPEFSFVGRGRNEDGSGESVAVLYRNKRFSVDKSGTFWFSNRPDVPGTKPGQKWGNPTHPRICTWVRLVQNSTGRALYVYNVHLQHNAGDDPELARVRSVLLLTERIKNRDPKDTYIVTGDFNATPNEVPILFLTKGNSESISYCPASGVFACHELINFVPMIDTWATAHPNSTLGTRCNGGSGAGKRIDYIFVAPDGHVGDVVIGGKVTGICPSDHIPVTATLLIPLGE